MLVPIRFSLSAAAFCVVMTLASQWTATLVAAETGTWTPVAGGTYYWLDVNDGNANQPIQPPWGVSGAGTSISPFVLGPIPNSTDSVANLTNNIVGNQTLLLNAAISLGTLNVGDADSSHFYTIASGDGGSFVFDVSTGSAAINKTGTTTDVISAGIALADPINVTVGPGGQLNLTGVMSGTSTLTKLGGGTLLAGGASTYSGGTILSEGVVKLGSSTVGGLANSTLTSGPLGVGAVTIATASVVTLQSDSGSLRTLANALIANADFTLGAAGTGPVMLGGTVNLGSGAPRNITVVGNQFVTGVISGGSLAVNGTGTLHLRGSNTQTTLTLATGATVVAGANAALGAGTVTINGATLASDTSRTLSNAIVLTGDLVLGGNPLTAGIHDGQVTLGGTMNLGGVSRTVTTNTSGVPTIVTTVADTISGVISNGALVKAGNGRLVLSGTNTTISGITINEGVLAFAAAANLGANPSTVLAGTDFIKLNGGTLAFTANSQINAQSNMGLAVNANSGIQVSDPAGTLVMFNNTAATMTGTGDLTKTGAGTFLLVGSGTSTWSGNLHIVGGTVSAGSSGVASTGSLLAAVSSITLQSGTTFRILNGTSAAGQSTTRVNDAASITLNGGTIFFDTAPTAGLDYEETLGAVTLNRGINTITADGASATSGDTSLLTITNLVRTNGTHRGVVNFNSSDANLLGTSDRNRILLTNLNGATPVAGFIGGWATVGTAASGVASDWAKYDGTNGVTAFAAGDYNGGGAFAETGMTAAAYHARIAPATATPVAQTAARTVGTLTFAASAAAGNVTFTQSGFDLNIDSGGVLVTGTATTTAHSIAGGTLSAGSGNELLFHVIGTNSLGVASSINGTTAVIKAGAGVLTLSGTNSFSGGLYLQQGTIRIANAVNGTSTSLASGNTVNVISGILAGNSTNPFILGNNITIHDSLTLGDAVGAGHNFLTGNITLTAPNEGIASIIAHTGTTTTVTGNISGGSLRIAQVAATGSVELAGNNNFGVNDRIQVDSGLLGVGSSTALGSAKIVLNGGGIFNALGYRGKITNDILITATSSMGSGAYLEKTDLAGTVDLSGTMRSLTVNGIHQEISGRITNGGLQKEGNGVLIISGTSNDYLGGTIANDGVLWLKGNATLGANIAGNNVDVSVSAGRDAVLRMDGPQNIGSNQILSIASQTTTGMPTLVLGKGFSATTALNPLIDFNNTGTGILNVRVSNTTNDKMMLALDGWALNHDLIAEINAVAPNAQVWIGTTGANGSIAAPLSAGQGGFYRFGGGSEVNISGTNYAGTLTLEANVLSGSGGLIIGAPNATALANITTTSNAVFLKGAQTGFSGAVTFGNGGTAIIANGAAMGTGSTVNLDMGGTGNGMAAFRTSGFSGYTNVNNTYGTKNFNVLSDSRIRLDADGGGRTFAAQFGTVGINVTGGATRTFEVQDVSNSGEAQFGTWTVNYSGTGAATLAFTTASGFTRLEGGIAQNGVGVVNLNKTNAAGTLIIDGTNALTGTTSLQRGVIILTGTQGLSSGGLIFGNNAADAAALHLRNDALASSYNFGAISFNGNSTGQQTILTGASTNLGLTGGTQTLDGSVTVSGPKILGIQALQGRTLNSTGNYSLTGAAGETFTINVEQGRFEISGIVDSTTVTNALTKSGRGMLILSGANTFTSATNSITITSGTLVLANDSALGGSGKTVTLGGTASNELFASGTRNITNNILSTNAATRIIGGLDAGSKVFSGTFSNTGAGGVIGFHAATGGDTTFSGIISSTSTTAVGYTKFGQGRVILSGANTFGNASAGTDLTVVRGTLEGIAQSGASPFGAATNDLIIAGGTLQLTGVNATTNTSLATLTVGGTNLGGYLHLRDLASGDGFNTQLTITAATNQLVRAGRGVLVIVPQFGNLGSQERLTFTTTPGTSNGILAPWLLTQTSAANTSGNFVTMSGNDVVAKTYTAGIDQGDLNVLATTVTSVFNNNVSTLLTAGKSVYALRTDSSIDLGGNDLSVGDTTNVNPGTNNPMGGLILNNGANITNGRVLTNASNTVIYVGGGNTSTISAAIAGSPITSSTASLATNVLNKTGAGVLELSNSNNSYSGATNIVSGTLRAGAANILGHRTTNSTALYSGLTVAAGATFDMSGAGFDQRIGSLTGQGTFLLGSNRLIVGDDGTSTIFSGQIAGAGTIIKTGGGALDFQNVDAANPNSFGNLFVDQGIARFVISEGAPLPLVVNDQFLGTTTSSIPSGTLVTLRGGELRFYVAEDFGTGVFNSLNSGVDVVVQYGGTINSASGYGVGAFTENKFININNLTLNETMVTFSNANTVGVNVAGTTTMTNDARFAISSDTTFSGIITGSGNKGYTLNKTEGGNLAIANALNDYAGGTVITGGRVLFGSRNLAYDYVHNVNTFVYNSTAKAGTGDIWVNPNSQLRLSETNLNAGQLVYIRSAGTSAAVGGNQSRLEIFNDAPISSYNLRSTTSGALTLMMGSQSQQNGIHPGRYTQALDMAVIGNGQWGLAVDDFDVTYDVATLGAGIGNSYRFFGGSQQLNFSRANVITGTANVQIGLGLGTIGGVPGSGTAIVMFNADQDYTGDTIIQSTRTTAGVVNTLRVLGDLGTKRIENYSRLELNGSGRLTNDDGLQTIDYVARGGSSLRLDYDAGFGPLVSSQANYLTDTSVGSGANAGPLTNKWQDNLAVTLVGSQLNLVNAGARDTVEIVGGLNVFGGGEIYLESRTSGATTLMINGALQMNAGSVLTFRALTNTVSNPGGTSNRKVMVSNPGDVPSLITVGSIARPMISPRFVTATNVADVPYTFTTYDSVLGFTAANFDVTSSTATFSAGSNDGTALVDLTAAATTVGTSDILALRARQNISAGGTITVRSGGLILFPGTADTGVTIATNLNFANVSAVDAYIWTSRNTSLQTHTLSGNVTAANLTVSGVAQLTLSGSNAFAGNATINGGILQFNSVASANGLNSIILHSDYHQNLDYGGGARRTYARLNLAVSTGSVAFNKDLVMAAGVPFAEFVQSGQDLEFTMNKLIFEDAGSSGSVISLTNGNNADLAFLGTTTLGGTLVNMNVGGSSNTVRLAGIVSGDAKLVKTGAQELRFDSEFNNFTGGLVINEGLVDMVSSTSGSHLGTGPVELNRGTLRSRSDTAAVNFLSNPNGMLTIRGNGTILDVRRVSGTTAIAHNWGSQSSVLRTEGSPIFIVQQVNNVQLRWVGDVVVNDNPTIRVDSEIDVSGTRGGLVFGNQLANTEVSGSGFIYKYGVGTLSYNYNAASTYTGGIQVSQGILRANTVNDVFTTGSTGTNGIYIAPGAAIHVQSLTNLNNSSATIRQFHSNSTATAVLALSNAGLATANPASFLSAAAVTSGNADGSLVGPLGGGSNGGVLSIQGITYSGNLNMGTLFGGHWFLGGGVFGTGTYSNAALGVGAGNTYRLGGGDGGIVFTQANVLTGTANVLIGKALAFQGGGTVQITNTNNFSGGLLELTQSRNRVGESNGIQTTNNTLQTNAGGFGQTNSPFSNAVMELVGTLQYFGANGSNVNNGGTGNRNVINFHVGSRLLFDNDNGVTSATINTNQGRWADSVGIAMNGSVIQIAGETVSAATTGQSETVGAVTFERSSAVRIVRQADDGAELIFASLGRVSTGTLTFTHNTSILGTNNVDANANGSNVERLKVTAGIGTLGTGIALEAGSVAGTGLRSLVGSEAEMVDPYLISRSDKQFMRYNATNGFQTYSSNGTTAGSTYLRVQTSAQTIGSGRTIGSTGITSIVGGAVTYGASGTMLNNGTEILDISGVVATLGSDVDVLAVRMGGANGAIVADAANLYSNLTIRSGGLIAGVTNDAAVIRSNVTFGKAGSLREALIYIDQNSLTIDGQIKASAITKFGSAGNDAGVLSIAQDQASFNGTWTVNGGTLQILTAYGLGTNGTNEVVLNGFVNPDGGNDQNFKTELRFNLTATGNALFGDANLNQFYHGTITAFNQNTIRAVTSNDRQYKIGNINAKTTYSAGMTMPGVLQFRVDGSRTRLLTGEVKLFDDYAIYVDASSFSGPGATSGVIPSLINNQGLYDITKLGDGVLYLGDMSGTNGITGNHLFTVNEGAVRVSSNGSFGSAGMTAIIDNGGVVDVAVAGFAPTASLVQQNGSIERWSVDGARSGSVTLSSGVHLQVNADQSGPLTVNLNGGSVMGYLAIDLDEVAVIRTLGAGVSLNLLADSFLGQPFVGGGAHRYYDIGKINNFNNPLDPRLQGAVLQIKGNISGNFDLTKIGQDVIILEGANSYKNTIVREGVLMAGADNTLPLGGRITTAANGILDLNGFHQSVGSISGASGVITSGATTRTVLTTGSDNSDTTYSGILAQSVRLNKVGAGELTLGTAPVTAVVTANSTIVTGIPDTASFVTGMMVSGPGIPAGATIARILSSTSVELSIKATTSGTTLALGNSHTGGTLLTSGKVKVFADAALGNAPSSAALGADNVTFEGGTLHAAGTFETSTYRGFQINAAGGTVEVDATRQLTIQGMLAGAGQFAKTGTGILQVNSNATHTGKVSVDEGTLKLGATASLADASWIEVKSGATYDTSLVAGGARVDSIVSGSGTVNGSLVVTSNRGAVNSNGVIKAGNSSSNLLANAGDLNGTLTINGNLTLDGAANATTRAVFSVSSATLNDYENILLATNSGTLTDYLNSKESAWNSASAGDHDVLVIGGTLELHRNGQLEVINWNPVFGDVLDLMDWSTVLINDFRHGGDLLSNARQGGLAGDLLLPTLGSGLSYDMTLFNTSGIVVVAPEPSRALLLLGGLVVAMWRRRLRA